MIPFGSLCSGIEAASVASAPLGWKPVFFSEIEKFPNALLDHYYPEVPNLGDMNHFKDWNHDPIRLLCGGTPCQSYSIAGLRKGLDDPRGNLTLTYVAVAERANADWVFWENVPGVLSSNGGADFAAFISTLTGYEYRPPADGWGTFGIAEGAPGRWGIAWAVLDGQYFGLAQRRKRVFVVGYIGDWRAAAAVLLDAACLRGDPAPRREKGKAAPTIPSRSTAGGGLGTDFDLDGRLIANQTYRYQNDTDGIVPDDVSATLKACSPSTDERSVCAYITEVAHTLRGEGFDASDNGTGNANLIPEAWPADLAPTLNAHFGDKMGLEDQHINQGAPMFVPAYAIQERAICENPNAGPDGVGVRDDGLAYTLEARQIPQAVAFGWNKSASQSLRIDGDTTDALQASPTSNPAVAVDMQQITSPENRSQPSDISPTLNQAGNVAVFKGGQGAKARGIGYSEDTAPTLTSGTSGTQQSPSLMQGMQVRRLTPRECERLQGFPDDYTLIPIPISKKYRKLGDVQTTVQKMAADGPRYKALGNSWAVPCVRWIFERIDFVDKVMRGVA